MNFCQVVGVVSVTVLNSRQYCVVLDPVGSDGKPQLGKKKLVQGEKTFFLQPGEKLAKGIQDVYVLEEDEGLILRCTESFKEDGVSYSISKFSRENSFSIESRS
jgi:major vault protein